MKWRFGNTTESVRIRLEDRIGWHAFECFDEIRCLKFALAVIDSMDGTNRRKFWPSKCRVFGRGHRVTVAGLIQRYGCFDLLPAHTEWAEPGDLVVVGDGDNSAHVYLVGGQKDEFWHWDGEAISCSSFEDAPGSDRVRFVARHRGKGEW